MKTFLLSCFFSLSAFASSNVIKCDNGAVVIWKENVGNPASGHGYVKYNLTLHNRDIAQYFADQGIFGPYYNADWNDTFVQKEVRIQSDGAFLAEFIVPRSDYHVYHLWIKKENSGLKLEAFENIGDFRNGRTAYGPMLANWYFQSCEFSKD